MLNFFKYILFAVLIFVSLSSCLKSFAQDNKINDTAGASTRNPKYNTKEGLIEFTTCKIPKKAVKIWDLGKVNEFLPIIPAKCANDSDGDIRPLTIAIIPDLIIRIIGLLFSLAFWLVPLWIILYGFFIIALPFDQGLNTQSTVSVATIGKKAAGQAIELVGGVVLISISYTIVMTVLSLIGLDERSVTTDLSNFFTP